MGDIDEMMRVMWKAIRPYGHVDTALYADVEIGLHALRARYTITKRKEG